HEVAVNALITGDQTAADACNRRLDRNACRHKGKGGAAYGAPGCGAVGGKHFGYYADAVREVIHTQNNGKQRFFSKRDVADLTSARFSGRLCFANAERREVVVVDISLFFLLVQPVQLLAVAHGTKRGNGKHLRLASCEHAGAVRSLQQVNLRV